MEEVITLNANYAEILKRRMPMSLVVAMALVLMTLGLALGLPSVYKSRAVILIEQQEIPQDLVRSLVTSFADQRIQTISQRVLTNNNLSQIIQKYDLYSKERNGKPIELVLEKMRKDITVLPISADVVDPKQGKSVQATIAFELAYENKSPEIAQRVANEVVSLFLNENLKQRQETSQETLTFLTAESEKLRAEVAGLESKLAEFKQGNVEQLPELTNVNIELMNRTESEKRALETQIQSLEQQHVYLESELAQQKPTMGLFSESGERILGPSDRLKVLESQFTPLASRYGANHPDVVAKRKEIESLRAQVGSTNAGGELALRLKGAEADLGQAQKKYSADHPDVKRLTREVAALKSQLVSVNASANPEPVVAHPDNPAFIQLQARLAGTNSDLGALRAQLASMSAKLANLEKRLTNAPQVERQYRMLTRDYETAQRKYQEVLAKRQEAEIASSLETKQQGERFTLIEPPVVPQEPAKPNRLAIGLLGGLLSIAGGFGSGALAESLDGRVYGRSGVSRLLGVPPLAVIPKLENAQTRRRRVRNKLMVVAALLLLLAVIAIAVHVLFRPLDVLFYQILRVLGT